MATYSGSPTGEGGHYNVAAATNVDFIIERPTEGSADVAAFQPPLLDYGSAWMNGFAYDTSDVMHDMTTDYYDYSYLYGAGSNLLESNYQPGENPYGPTDDWVFWQWGAAQ